MVFLCPIRDGFLISRLTIGLLTTALLSMEIIYRLPPVMQIGCHLSAMFGLMYYALAINSEPQRQRAWFIAQQRALDQLNRLSFPVLRRPKC